MIDLVEKELENLFLDKKVIHEDDKIKTIMVSHPP
jgi:hypothetical protein